MTAIQAILISSVSDTAAYVLIAIGVFITLRVLAFPHLTVDGSFVTGGSIAAVMIAAGHNPFLATLAALIGEGGLGWYHRAPQYEVADNSSSRRRPDDGGPLFGKPLDHGEAEYSAHPLNYNL